METNAMKALRPFPSRRTTAICLVAAAAISAIGFAVTPWEGERTVRSYHEALAAHPGQAQVSAVLLHFGYMLFAPAAVGILALMAPRGGWLFRIGAVLAVLGMTTLPGLLVTDAYDLALAQELPRDAGVAAAEAVEDIPLSMILGLPAVAGTILGLWVLAFGLWRIGEAPVAFPILMVAGWVISFATFEPVVIIVGGVVMTAGCLIAARRLWNATPPVAAAAPVRRQLP
jgi:hypothetical protein